MDWGIYKKYAAERKKEGNFFERSQLWPLGGECQQWKEILKSKAVYNDQWSAMMAGGGTMKMYLKSLHKSYWTFPFCLHSK